MEFLSFSQMKRSHTQQPTAESNVTHVSGDMVAFYVLEFIIHTTGFIFGSDWGITSHSA